ncbi:hypothetical protein NUW54_g14506 [Trametes sanguinea]|uniref:Uncharacterized protein n=1 Tax=Trametes sanguinea TaxID=158606 RepID=A0ACC1MCA1_9APHY|nr:hypothetical protein NUW54_g14506 [Trametes sanguinea]
MPRSGTPIASRDLCPRSAARETQISQAVALFRRERVATAERSSACSLFTLARYVRRHIRWVTISQADGRHCVYNLLTVDLYVMSDGGKKSTAAWTGAWESRGWCQWE